MKLITYVDSGIKCTRVPSKIVCVGRNYVEHAQELGNAIPANPIIFIKPNSAIGEYLYAEGDVNNQPVTHHYEAELCLLISNKNICAVGFGLDLTRRQIQQTLKKEGLPWERAKAFDGAAVFSDFVPITPEAIADLSIRLSINNTVIQHGSVDMMLFKPTDLLEEISTFLSLEDNDVVMTGTPKGVGPVKAGDCFIGEVFLSEQCLVRQEWTAI